MFRLLLSRSFSPSQLGQSRRPRRAATVPGLIAIFAILSTVPALGWGMHQVIIVDAPSSVVAGETLDLDLTLSESGSAAVTVYSDPPGAVSYQGTVSGTQATVPAQTDPNASGDVTVFAQVDGSNTISTTTVTLL